MGMLAATLAFAAPLAIAGELGGAIARTASTYPEIVIRKAESEHEWPFAVDEGTLSCITYAGTRSVFFSEPWRTDVPQEFGNMTLPRMVIVSTNPLALFVSFEDRSLYAPYDNLVTLIRRLAPFEKMGLALCDAEAGQLDDGGDNL